MNTERGNGSRHRRGIIGWGIAGILVLLLVGAFLASTLTGVITPTPYAPWRFFLPFGFFFPFFLLFALGWLFGPWRWRYYHGHRHHRDDAAEILKQRYARGEITREQFQQMRQDLEAHK